MTDSVLAKLFEHHQWANLRLIQGCAALAEPHLDAKPRSPDWSIRLALIHLVESQQGYLELLTLPLEARQPVSVPFAEIEESARRSGEALLAIARDGESELLRTRLRTRSGYFAEPWVVLLQAINHGHDHRRQVCDILRDLEIQAPALDGWTFGLDTKGLVKIGT